jgi:hypothetical protein
VIVTIYQSESILSYGLISRNLYSEGDIKIEVSQPEISVSVSQPTITVTVGVEDV